MSVMGNWFQRLFSRDGATEQRTTPNVGYLPLSLSGGSLALGAGLSEELSLTVSAVYAAVDRISSSLASVPFNIYERFPDGSRRLAREYDQFRLVHTAPNDVQTSFQFRKILMSHALLWGNGFAQLVRNEVTSRPMSYRIIKPGDVQDIRMVDGELYYFISNNPTPIAWYDMLHIQAMGQYLGTDTYFGKSPIRVHSEMIGAARLRNQYGASVMQKGGFMSGIVKYAGQLTPEQKAAIRDSFNQRYAGAGNAGSTAVLEYGLDYQQLTMNPADIQLIETMKFTVEDVARIYGIPPHMIGHLERSTNNNIEHQAIEYVQYCLMPWAVLIEQVFDSKIFRISEREVGRYYTKLELNALMRGDVAGRREFYRLMLDRGVFSINETRGLEDMNPVEGGDIRLVQANMIPLDQIRSHYEKPQSDNGSTQS